MKRQTAHIKLTNAALWLLCGLALLLLPFGLSSGPSKFVVFTAQLVNLDLNLSLFIDPLSVILFVMVTVLGVSIGNYSIRYLDGERRQAYFYRFLLWVIISVSLLVLSSNLLMFFLAWWSTGYGLNKLLTYNQDRPQAVLAARKKLWISRLGEMSLAAAIVLTYQFFGTLEFDQIFAALSVWQTGSAQPEDYTLQLAIIGCLYVFTALSSSVQFPFHFWLPETMETPTPVSALMHAGVINAGGFLVIRLSPLLQEALGAHVLLILVGTLSAIFGALCMMTQNTIKTKLAYSTVSQMGMMMFACGLGAYGIALFHIFAHSFYKAHAFLSTGNLIEETKKVGFKLKPPGTLLSLVATLSTSLMVIGGYVVEEGAFYGPFTYGSVILLGLFLSFVPVKVQPFRLTRSFIAICIVLIIAGCVYAGIEYMISDLLSGQVPAVSDPSPWRSLRMTASVIAFTLFVGCFWLSGSLMQPDSLYLKRLYVYLWNGGYFGHMSSRMMRRLYPQPTKVKRWSKS